MIDLTLACARYDRTEGLRDGRVRPEGMRLTYLPLEAEEAFLRMLQHGEFDAAEMSLGAYVSRRGRRLDDFLAIPVFPSRMFRHGAIYVPYGSGAQEPRDLVGGRVGIPEYRMTAGVWVRGFLAEDFGLSPTDVTWVVGGLEQPGRTAREPFQSTAVRVVEAPSGRALSSLLEEGAIDALVSARAPSCFHHGTARRLFAEPWRLDRDYFRRTRIFPIMHTIVVRQEVLSRYPWIAQSLVKAFTEAKNLTLPNLLEESALATSLPFQIEAARDTLALMGPDPWPYGVDENRGTLAKFLGLAMSQELIPSGLTVESLFVPSTLEPFVI